MITTMKTKAKVTVKDLISAIRCKQEEKFIELVNECEDIFEHDEEGHSLMWHAKQAGNPLFAETLKLMADDKSFKELKSSGDKHQPKVCDNISEASEAPAPVTPSPESAAAPGEGDSPSELKFSKSEIKRIIGEWIIILTVLIGGGFLILPVVDYCSILFAHGEKDLLESIERNDPERLQKQLNAGGESTVRLLEEAVKRNRSQCVEILAKKLPFYRAFERILDLKHAYRPDATMETAISEGKNDCVQALARTCCAPSEFVIFAIKEHKASGLKALLEEKADPNTRDSIGRTALAVAVKENDLECVKALLKAGADCNLADKDGNTPLIYAAEEDRVECMKILLGSGKADTEHRAENGNYAIHYAAGCGHLDCLKVLIRDQAALGPRDKYGHTPLAHAAAWGHTDVMKFLLSAGAAKLESNASALEAAFTNDYCIDPSGAVKVLLSCNDYHLTSEQLRDCLESARNESCRKLLQRALDKKLAQEAAQSKGHSK